MMCQVLNHDATKLFYYDFENNLSHPPAIPVQSVCLNSVIRKSLDQGYEILKYIVQKVYIRDKWYTN